jgi:glycine cleavage system H protein
MTIERFTRDHEWIRVDGDTGIVGITRHAAEQLGDVVFVELPEAGRTVKASEAVAVVESVKAASEVFAPISGEVIESNGELTGQPALVNEDAEGRAWFFKVRVGDSTQLDSLMDRAAYEAFAKESS